MSRLAPVRNSLLLAACLLAPSCGSLEKPTEPQPEANRPTPTPQGGGSYPTPIFGAPTPASTPTPTPSPGATPTPEPTPTPDSSGCSAPLPPPVSTMAVKVHLKGSDAWTLDSTPLVGPDLEYCTKVGFIDRATCPVRPEGHPQRSACELYAVGRAKDTHRPGPTWYFNNAFCTGPDSGCMNHPENQYQLKVWVGGTFKACAQNGVCGEVVVDR